MVDSRATAASGIKNAAPFLEMAAVGKRFGGVQALADVDFTLYPGEIHCLVGENGSGKSTLIKIISGVLDPEPGARIALAGEVHHRLSPHDSTRLGVQVIYQDLSLFPNLTVAENIGFSVNVRHPLSAVRRRRMAEMARHTMAQIGVRLPLGQTVETLSIANRQIVAICRALAADARLLIMDEPTASLTRQEVDALFRVVADLRAKGLCIVFVSHRLEEVLEIADTVTVLRDGRKVGVFDPGDIDHRKLSFLMTGQSFQYEIKRGRHDDAEAVLEVAGLGKRGDFHDVTFDIRAGEVLGLTGLLGSGRTELALSLFGMNPPDRGTVRLHGKALRLASNRQAIADGIAYVSEDRLTLGLVMEQPIGTNIIVAILNRLLGRSGLIDPARRATAVDAWIKELAIRVASPDNAVRELSGGNQQRVVLAKWMATQPKVLILDSPTVGVDVGAKSGIYQIIERLAAEGVAVLLISDEVPEVLYHSHRILVMRRGRIVGEYRPDAVSEHELSQVVNG